MHQRMTNSISEITEQMETSFITSQQVKYIARKYAIKRYHIVSVNVNYHEPYKTGDHEHTLLEQHLKNTHLMTKQIWNSPDELVRFVNK